ncbi:MAG: methyltransferase [Verrucomicrobia bacterium]|nr:MAG: methyltransferase [Verrucomicrobiota bacterium]
MTDITSSQSEANQTRRFLELLRRNLEQNSFIKLVLGKYRGQESDLRHILVRQLTVKGQKRLSFVYSYKTRDITKNTPIATGVETIGNLLGSSFKSAHYFSLAEDVQIEFSGTDKCTWSSSKATFCSVPSEKHNREKKRLLDPRKPFLSALGVTDEKHGVIPSMSRKWKQVNKFLEVFQHAYVSSQLSDTEKVHVVDFGSGKGYLTFAVHDFLQNTLKVDAHVTGIELRENLVHFCTDVARKLESGNLLFRQGDVSSYSPETIHILIALHACDTATDLAIHMGIRSGAEVIMCAPCCHKEIRQQIRSPLILQPVLQFGIHLGQEADMITDGLRALLLEAHGYKTQIFEFISLEHTSKNKMLLAVKHTKSINRKDILDRVDEIKGFYSIRDQYLETLLNKGL